MDTEVQKKQGKEHLVTVAVNEQPVELEAPKATGLGIGFLNRL